LFPGGGRVAGGGRTRAARAVSDESECADTHGDRNDAARQPSAAARGAAGAHTWHAGAATGNDAEDQAASRVHVADVCCGASAATRPAGAITDGDDLEASAAERAPKASGDC